MTKSLSRLQAFYQDFSAQALLRVMANKEFEGKIASLTSFGSDSAVLLALIADVKPDLPIFFPRYRQALSSHARLCPPARKTTRPNQCHLAYTG